MRAAEKNSNVTTVFQSDPKNTTRLESFYGALGVTSFILIWLASLASPLILFVAITRGYHGVSASIVAFTIIAYLPWKKGLISRIVHRFIDGYHPCYYDGVSIVFEGGDIPTPPPSTPGAAAAAKGEIKHRQTFFAVHPHGAFCIGWSLLFTSPLMHKVRFCFAPLLYASPFFRLFSRLVGKPGSAARPAMNGYLRRGEDVALPPGGFEEATLTSTAQDRVFIKKRYGFVRLCLKYGVAIRPVYVFGEGRLFSNIQGHWSTRLGLNRWGIPTTLVWGRWFLPLMPKKGVKIHIVVGRPLILPKIESPSKEEVSVWHNKYIGELKRIYEEYKDVAYGAEKGKETKLEVW